MVVVYYPATLVQQNEASCRYMDALTCQKKNVSPAIALERETKRKQERLYNPAQVKPTTRMVAPTATTATSCGGGVLGMFQELWNEEGEH